MVYVLLFIVGVVASLVLGPLLAFLLFLSIGVLGLLVWFARWMNG